MISKIINKPVDISNLLTKVQINEWIKINSESDNVNNNEYNPVLKTRLAEAKVLVDRWMLFSSDVIFNSKHRDYVKSTLGSDTDLWGMKFHFTDNIPINKGMLIDSRQVLLNPERSISLFDMPEVE